MTPEDRLARMEKKIDAVLFALECLSRQFAIVMDRDIFNVTAEGLEKVRLASKHEGR